MHESQGSKHRGRHVHLCTGKVSVEGAVQCWSLDGMSLLVFVHLGCFGGGLLYTLVAAQTHLHLSLLMLSFHLLRTRYPPI